MERNNLIGNKYGKLKVVNGEIKIRGNKQEVSWGCLCECGGTIHTDAYSLKHGKVVSCGCFRNSRIGIASFRHGNRVGRKFTVEYRAWVNMKNRCENHKRTHSDRYIGRGITYCEEWKDFSVFLKDMGKSPGGYYSIDRIDNDDGYSKENCRWSTKRQQAQNRSNNINLTIGDVTHCLAEWARRKGIVYGKLYSQYIRNNAEQYLSGI